MSNYTEDNIKVLSDIEHIRLRKGMYIGESNNPLQLFQEILDNAIDECQSGYSNKISIKVDTKNNEYSIRDYGRGIPLGKKMTDSGEEKYILEILCTKSNSGGKFDNDSYKFSTGLHGLGMTLTNALSSRFEIDSYRDGKCVYLIADNSEIITIKEYDYANEILNGTCVSFIPNPEYFDTEIIPKEYIIDKCNILSAFGFLVELFIDDEKVEFNDYNSIYDLLPEVDNSYCKNIFKYVDEDNQIIEVAMNYHSGTSYNCIGYTNLLYNRYGGTHTKQITKAICDVWSEFSNKLDVELKYDDCTLGLNVLVAVFINDIAFSSQTKEKLTIPVNNLQNLISGFKDQFREYLIDNENLRLALLKRFEEYRISQNKLLSQKEIMKVVKINNSTDGKIHRKSVVPGLIECTSTVKNNTELFLCEGRSAAGPIARARNKKTQSVLPLRGKIKNVTYMDIKSALKSEVICNIVNAIGAGVGNTSDSAKSRYDKIIIMCDSDDDGKHITALLASCIINLVPNIVKDGLLYVVEAPLFGYNIKGDKERKYTDNFNEVPSDAINFTRYKGLGEMDDIEFRDTCLVAGHRKIYRIDYPKNIDKFNEILGTSSGKSNLLKDLGVMKYITGSDDEDAISYENDDI